MAERNTVVRVNGNVEAKLAWPIARKRFEELPLVTQQRIRELLDEASHLVEMHA